MPFPLVYPIFAVLFVLNWLPQGRRLRDSRMMFLAECTCLPYSHLCGNLATISFSANIFCVEMKNPAFLAGLPSRLFNRGLCLCSRRLRRAGCVLYYRFTCGWWHKIRSQESKHGGE